MKTFFIITDLLQQTAQVNIENEEFLTRTPASPHASSQVLDWVVDQQLKIRGSSSEGEDTDDTALFDSD